MDIISLLVIVLFLSYLVGKNTSPYARAVLGSVFGIFYLGIWRFTIFYLDLFQYQESVRKSVLLGLMVVATLLALGLIRIKYVTTVAATCVVLFIVAMVATFSLDVPIKNAIASQSGLFQPVTATPFLKNPDEQLFTQDSGNYQVAVPASWQLRTDKGPQFPYYQWRAQDKLLLEFRPRCFDSSQTTIADILMNMRSADKDVNLHTEFHCTKDTTRKTVACKADRYQAKDQLKRVEYFARADQASKGIELDFVLSQNTADITQAIDRVIDSLQPLLGKGNNSQCLGLAEWM